MKNLWQKISGFLILLLPPVVATFVPEVGEAGGVDYLIATITGTMTLTILLTEPLKNLLGTEGWATRIMSWAIALFFLYLSSAAGIAFMAWDWWNFALASVGIGLAANGLFTISQVKTALAVLFEILKQKE